MKILGLSIGELATAALMVDGKIVAAAHEERFSRFKNDERYPMKAIDYCLREAGLQGPELDAVAIAGMQLAFGPWVTRTYSTFTMADHVRAQRDYWYPKLYEGKEAVWTQVFKDKLDLEQFPGNFAELLGGKDSYYSEENWERLRASLYRGIEGHLGVPASKIVHVDHHTCHAAYAYWGSPFRGAPTLVLTADAFGDGLSATVSIAENGAIRRVHAVPDRVFRLARLYRYITLLLGMKPNEHEYKVMGLAAYAKPEVLKRPYEIFKKTMQVEGLDFGWKETPPDMYFYFKDRLEGCRFDGIAGGLQLYLEEILSQWVKNAITRTGIGRVVISGGIAMNVKAHKVLHEMEDLDSLFVCGSGADESLAMGLCYHLMEKDCARKGLSSEKIVPHSMYLGPRYDRRSVRQWMEKNRLQEAFDIESDVGPDRVAQCLLEGQVIGRLAGRMEFGQRALGNRSILADPRNREMIDKINRKIKNRDFWMPFAPSVLEEEAGRYLVNPKGIPSPHMTVAFDSTPLARKDLAATLHPADHTMRPQVLKREDNPEYHDLLAAFRRKSGVGGVLNTSFNLHGEPIVCSPEDAFHVFTHSDIDMILLEDVLVKKRNGSGKPAPLALPT